MQKQTIEVNGHIVDIKARRENHGVIAVVAFFASVFSIRSDKLELGGAALNQFADALCGAAWSDEEEIDDEAYAEQFNEIVRRISTVIASVGEANES